MSSPRATAILERIRRCIVQEQKMAKDAAPEINDFLSALLDHVVEEQEAVKNPATRYPTLDALTTEDIDELLEEDD